VGTEVQPLPDVRRTNACRSKYRLPNGVVLRFQVSLNKVEPAVSNRIISLLSKQLWRAELADESYPMRPEVTRVIKPSALACAREAWAGAGDGQSGFVVSDSRESESVGPHANSGEQMPLDVASEVIGLNIDN
jgi:hypothetical protein